MFCCMTKPKNTAGKSVLQKHDKDSANTTQLSLSSLINRETAGKDELPAKIFPL